MFNKKYSIWKWLLPFIGLTFVYLSTIPVLAHHSDLPDPCLDITSQGQEVLMPGSGGIPNSGVLNFDPNPGPDHQYEACLRDAGGDGAGPFQLEGWLWDTNLGWVSLYCNGGMNLGLACGSQNYGVTMDGSESATPGRLHGYAWGDNAGWISFNCDGPGVCGASPYAVEVETVDESCLGEVFGASAPTGCFPNSSNSVYAWSDNVGWIDLTGVVFPWGTLSDNGEVNVEFTITPDPATTGNKLQALAADGVSHYDLKLKITEADTGLAIDPNDYTITAQLNWADSVDLNQTDASSGDYSACKDCGGAVTKPISFSDFGFVSSEDAFIAEVTSLAPTSDLNGYDNGTGVVSYLYETFTLPTLTVPQNLLSFNGLSLSVKKNSNSVCAYGTTPGCTLKDVGISGGGSADVLAAPLTFKPAAEITELKVNDKDYFSAQYNVATNFDFSSFCSSQLNCSNAIAIFTLGVDAPFKFVYPGADNTATYSDDNRYQYIFGPSAGSFQAVPVLQNPGPTQVGNAYTYSIITYNQNGKQVSYFSNKLPRVKGTLVLNPVASIRGNVYSTGVTNPQEGNAIKSLGDISTNLLRDAIFRNISNIIAGAQKPSGSATIDEYDNQTGFNVSNGGAVTKLWPDNANVPKLYYFQGDVTFASATDLSWQGERTIVVNGADVYIDANLYNSTISSPRARLGIIAFKDLVTNKGGNVYIAPGVTNIQANIFADGGVFSYDGNKANINTTTGEPVFASEQSRQNILPHQLYIEGSIASANTIGGAVADKPILGNGKEESPIEGQYTSNPTGRSRARLYDLNFLRYYGPVFKRLPNGSAEDLDGDGQIEAQLYTGNQSGGDLVKPQTAGLNAKSASGLNQDTDLNAVYIYFDPPTATLPGFGISGNLDLKQLKR
jgi:hypothetical protein